MSVPALLRPLLRPQSLAPRARAPRRRRRIPLILREVGDDESRENLARVGSYPSFVGCKLLERGGKEERILPLSFYDTWTRLDCLYVSCRTGITSQRVKWKITRPIENDVDRKITRHFWKARIFNVSVQRGQKFGTNGVHQCECYIIINQLSYLTLIPLLDVHRRINYL